VKAHQVAEEADKLAQKKLKQARAELSTVDGRVEDARRAARHRKEDWHEFKRKMQRKTEAMNRSKAKLRKAKRNLAEATDRVSNKKNEAEAYRGSGRYVEEYRKVEEAIGERKRHLHEEKQLKHAAVAGAEQTKRAASRVETALGRFRRSEETVRQYSKSEARTKADVGVKRLKAKKTGEELERATQLLKFAKLSSLGLKPGICCKQVHEGSRLACLTCRCEATAAVREANGHCLSCQPGQIHLQDVNGVGVCREWDKLEQPQKQRSTVRTACPLYPHRITQLQNKHVGFSCYRWGFDKTELLAPQNTLKLDISVRPLCKAKKHTSCGKQAVSAGNKNMLSRSCSVKKSATCVEVWIEFSSIIKYFEGQAKKSSRSKTQLQEDETEDLGESALITTNRDSHEAKQKLQTTFANTKARAYAMSKCKQMGGRVRDKVEHQDQFRSLCVVDCNPADPDLRGLLGLPGTKWKTTWRAGDWCQAVVSSI